MRLIEFVQQLTERETVYINADLVLAVKEDKEGTIIAVASGGTNEAPFHYRVQENVKDVVRRLSGV